MVNFNSIIIKVKDIYTMFEDGVLIIDNGFQRHSIWGERDKIRLIETIMLNMVIPEFFFWNKTTHIKNNQFVSHIIDGRQRINAVVDFIEGKFLLREDYLMEFESIVKWKNKYFNQFTDQEKEVILNYQLMVISIDMPTRRDEIFNMFYRYNLTNLSLYDQERRNLMHGEFALLARELSELEFWFDHNLFSGSDVKLMKDIEFCASLILLHRNGIIDQTDHTAVNNAYEDMYENYIDAKKDKESILLAIEIANKISDICMDEFLESKANVYTIFSVIFYAIRQNIQFTDYNKHRLRKFAYSYNLIVQPSDFPTDSPDEKKRLAALVSKYKLASLDNKNSVKNRTTRFIALKSYIFNQIVYIE